MKITKIETPAQKLEFDRQVLQVKSKFLELGFNQFPTDLILEFCPFNKPKDVNKWKNRAAYTWRGRSRDLHILEVFNKAIKKISHE